MTTKFIALSDSHFRASSPSCRTDKDFFERQFIKLAQIIRFGKEHKIAAVLHGGDFFDSNDPTLRLIHDMVTALKESTGIPWLVNPGNHDFFGGAVASLKRSGLGVLSNAGIVHTFYEREEVTFANGSVVIRFLPYTLTDVHANDDYWFVDKDPNKHYILIPHSMITTHFVPFPHVLYTDVKTNADLILCSHWHSQFDVTANGTRFVNSGPLTRQTTHEARLRPSVLLFTVSQGTPIAVERLMIDAPDSKDVIDLSVDAPAAMEGIAEQFMSVLREGALEGVDRQRLVRIVGERHGFQSSVIDNGLMRVQAAERVMESV